MPCSSTRPCLPCTYIRRQETKHWKWNLWAFCEKLSLSNSYFLWGLILFSFWWILTFLFHVCHLSCLMIYFSCSENWVFRIIWLYPVLVSRSKSFNFIDGTGIITWGSLAVYLNPVLLPRNGPILAFGLADTFIKFLGYM